VKRYKNINTMTIFSTRFVDAKVKKVAFYNQINLKIDW